MVDQHSKLLCVLCPPARRWQLAPDIGRVRLSKPPKGRQRCPLDIFLILTKGIPCNCKVRPESVPCFSFCFIEELLWSATVSFKFILTKLFYSSLNFSKYGQRYGSLKLHESYTPTDQCRKNLLVPYWCESWTRMMYMNFYRWWVNIINIILKGGIFNI